MPRDESRQVSHGPTVASLMLSIGKWGIAFAIIAAVMKFDPRYGGWFLAGLAGYYACLRLIYRDFRNPFP